MLILAVKRYKFFISARPLAAAEFLGAENLRLTPFAVKFFAAENPPKISCRSTAMRGKTQNRVCFIHNNITLSQFPIDALNIQF